MEHPTPRQPAARVMAASTAGEREILEAFLDFYRDVLAHKARGVGDQAARHRLLPSLTTLAGLVRHLTAVEQEWFHSLTGENSDTQPSSSEDAGWVLDESDTLESVLARYARACEVSRTVAARFTLDDVVPHPELGQVSLRWIYVHMIEETARHTGHADIVRELTDGATGVLG